MSRIKDKIVDRNHISKRTKLAAILIQLSLFSLFIRAIYIESVYGHQLRERTSLFSQNRDKKRIKRGKIVDRSGGILAINRNLISVWADPSFLNISPLTAAQQLAPIVGKSEEVLVAQLDQKKKKFVWLQRNIPYSELQAIRSNTRTIRGVNFQVHSKRHYPNDDLACHIIGVTNFAGHGIDGIERQYNPYLFPSDQ